MKHWALNETVKKFKTLPKREQVKILKCLKARMKHTPKSKPST